MLPKDMQMMWDLPAGRQAPILKRCHEKLLFVNKRIKSPALTSIPNIYL